MAKEQEGQEQTPETPLLAKYTGEFHVNTIGSRKLVNGNKIHIVLEGEYTAEVMAFMAPLNDKDVKITFKELLTKKTRKKVGEEDSGLMFGGSTGEEENPGIGPEP